MPNGALGTQVALGRAIFTDTARLAPRFVGNDLKCSNCHLDAGRRANAGPLWAAYGLYPQYRAKNGHVNTFAERLQECFRYSMNGRPPALGDPVLVSLESYAAFLAKGAPMGVKLPGHGYLRLPAPGLTPDYGRGQDVYAANCKMCHGVNGAGQRAGDSTVVPPPWGDRSFNWGAGMAEIDKAAGFIKANMPLGQSGKLTDQQAWDVAAYIDGKPRPQDPRFTGSVAQTRRKFHDSPWSLYGLTVNGVLLGGDGPPKVSARAGRSTGPRP
jgi:thiosulfate dehydrogenase